jgi:hypothetical protein
MYIEINWNEGMQELHVIHSDIALHNERAAP